MDKILPRYFTEDEGKEDSFYQELDKLQDDLKSGKIKFIVIRRTTPPKF